MITRKKIILGIILFLFIFSIIDMQQGVLPKRNKSFINIDLENLGQMNNLENFQGTNFGEYEHEVKFKKREDVSAEDISRLNINNYRGNVFVRGEEQNNIKVDYEVKLQGNKLQQLEKIKEEVKLETEKNSEQLYIRMKDLKKIEKEYDIKIITNLEITAPPSMVLALKNQFGETNLHNWQNQASIESNFGSVKLDNIEGSLEIDSRFTQYSITDSQISLAGKLSYGSLEAAEVKGDVNLEADIAEVSLTLPPDIEGWGFDVNSINSNITTSRNLTVTRRESGEYISNTGDEDKPVIRLTNSYGEIRIK
ncbi:MAG: hypothetical protein ACOC4G_07710 [Bacillota bacterium]